MTVQRLKLSQTAVLVVDVQERLLPVIHDHQAVLARVLLMLDAAKALDLPVLLTEQYPKGLGPTVPAVAERVTAATCRDEKMLFSACTTAVRASLEKLGATCVIVVGLEAHVCVLQTCLDLAEAGYTTAVALDAIGSRRDADKSAAILRMTQAGVVPTTVESAILELVGEAGTPRFKSILPLVK